MNDADEFALIVDLNTKLQKAVAHNPLIEQLLRVIQDVSYTSAKSVVANERIADTLEELLDMIKKERENE